MVMIVCFCCKQKTAYEMRISDWSSDVCSSDLCRRSPWPAGWREYSCSSLEALPHLDCCHGSWFTPASVCQTWRKSVAACRQVASGSRPYHPKPAPTPTRSEEHTSELQSLMRISYAVFCLKKKKINKTTTT